MKRSELYLKLTLALGKFVLLLFCFQRIFIKTFHLIKMTSTWWNEEQVDSSIISSHEYSMEAISLLCSSFSNEWKLDVEMLDFRERVRVVFQVIQHCEQQLVIPDQQGEKVLTKCLVIEKLSLISSNDSIAILVWFILLS